MARRRGPERTGEGERGSEQGLRDADNEEEGGEGREGREGCQEGARCVKKGVREGSKAQSAQEREGGGLGADGMEVGKVGCRGAERVHLAVRWCVGPRGGSNGSGKVGCRGAERVQTPVGWHVRPRRGLRGPERTGEGERGLWGSEGPRACRRWREGGVGWVL
jgi:hypothetical protein